MRKKEFSNIVAVVIDYIVAVSFMHFGCALCVQLYRKKSKKVEID